VITEGWRLRIEHTTRFLYATPSRASYNEVRKTPVTDDRQAALETRLTTDPVSFRHSYTDYWGTQVVFFDVEAPHDQLTITSRSLVETHRSRQAEAVGWSEVGRQSDRLNQYLVASQFTGPNAELIDTAQQLRARTPLATLHAVADWVYDALDYVSGITSVHTSATEAFGAGSGVCQDFAHLTLAVLRAAGIPSRYVSGYLHPDERGAMMQPITGESHAWVEAWLGQWWGFDPTNATEIGERHVSVARGRDYADVAPVKGIFAGRAQHTTDVVVSITRMA
jgi:transglutaminase-like putative cysteine protease